MTVTVDSFTLKCKRIGENPILIATDYDVWSGNSATKTRKIYGAKQQVALTLFESGVAWASGAAKYLRDLFKSGGTCVLTIDEGDRYSMSATTCYVVGFAGDYPQAGTANIRYFTVTFREV